MKSKLFLSLSLLTAVFLMSVRSIDAAVNSMSDYEYMAYNEYMSQSFNNPKHTTSALPTTPAIDTSKVRYATMFTPFKNLVQMSEKIAYKRMIGAALPEVIALPATPAIDSVNAAIKVPSLATSHNLKAGQALGGALETSIKKIGTNATSALCLTAGAATLAGTVYGLNKFNAYMHPETVTQTRFERVKAQVQKGYNSSLTFVKTHQKSVGVAAVGLTLGLLGYKMYQNKEAIFGKSQAVQANTVQAEEKPVVHIFRQRARD